MLKATHEPEAIEAAREAMLSFGTKPTGAYYPTGIERADNIARLPPRTRRLANFPNLRNLNAKQRVLSYGLRLEKPCMCW